MNKTASAHSFTAPTVEELVNRARELAPLLRKNAAAGETNRRVEEETIQAVAEGRLDAGVYAETLRWLGDEYPRDARC